MLFGRTSNLFDDFFGDMFGGDFFDTSSRMPQLMKTDVVEKDGQYMLDVELPGYDKNDISAELKDGYLTIMANKDQTIENKDEKSNYVRKERYTGSCQRSFYVGDDVKEEDIQAGFKDGILKIAVRKPELKEIKDDRKLIPIL
ncbi:MAG: Hsp20/alpha crystallin family protein [Lachnospiraceae bacterium]|nr:Hsp20/alpha crystallin family protein [Lachnospiraceae bacterium]MDD7147054.1 Hsp20/alpha crystallin family protein [Lachnospiraceae bacterium]MDY4068518.1 Hsp20/alpha crystallin family protein [Lachnospiraceae bacterium]